MKSIRTSFTLAFLAMALLWTGCKQGTTESTGTGEKVTLELKLKQGDVFRQVTKTTQTTEQKMMGMSTSVKTQSDTYLKQEVLSVSPEGVAEVRVTYERIVSSNETAMTGKQSYDSAKDTADLPAFAVGYGGLVGASITYLMDKQGQVKEVRGIDSLMNRIFDGAGLGEMGNEIRSSMKEMFGEESIKGMLQGMSARYPSSQMTVGDTWGGETKLGGGFGLVVANTYKLENVEAGKVAISTTGEVRTDKEGGMEIAGVRIEYNLTGTSDGSMDVDRNTGMVSASKIHQTISGSMKTMGMNVPIKIDQTVEVMPY